MDIHARKVRNKTLIAILLDIEDQDTFQFLRLTAVSFGAKKYAEFERHIETWQIVIVI